MLKTPMLAVFAVMVFGVIKQSIAQCILPGNNARVILQLPAAQPTAPGLADASHLTPLAIRDGEKTLAKLKSGGSLILHPVSADTVFPLATAAGFNQNYTRGYGFANARPLKIYDLLLREPLDRYAFYPAK